MSATTSTAYDAEAGTSQEPQFVDINNLNLAAEEDLGQDFDPDADLYSTKPIADETHIVKLSLSSDDPNKQWELKRDRDGRSYYRTQLTLRVDDVSSPFNGRVVFDNFVSTMIFGESGTSKVASIIKALGGFETELAQTTTHEQLARLFTRVLAGDPTCKVTTRWEATEITTENGKKVYNTFLKGMRSFPQDDNGNYIHIIKGPVLQEDVEARATVKRYLPLG